MDIKRYGLILAVIGSILTGCAKKESAQVATQVDNDFLNANSALEDAKNPRSKATNDTISMSEGVWLGSASVVLPHKNNLPSEFEGENGVTLLLNEPVTLQVLSNNIHAMTDIPVKIDSKISADKLSKAMNIAYTGKLSTLLTQIATDLDLLWYYDREEIVFYETETKTFTLFALGTDINYRSRIAADDANHVSLESNLREWEEVEKTIGGILEGTQNAKFTVSRSMGSITVTAPPSILQRVGDYINKQNQRLSQLIAINVKVLQVSIDNSNALGLNLGAAIQSAAGLQLVSNPVNNLTTTEAQGMNIAVLNNNVLAKAGLAAVDSSGVVTGGFTADQIAASGLGNLAGTDAFIQALAKQGKISLVTSAVVTTRNNRIAPVSNMKTTGYIKQFETRNFSAVEAATVDQAELDTGFSMQLMPNVLDNGRILLLFKMSIKGLLKMSTTTIGSVTLQLPETEERSFMQEVVMESGQTLVLSGFERITNNDTRFGIGDPEFMALGGSRETTSQRDVLVVIITPQVLVSPLDPERAMMQNWGAPLN